jgi:hypothetical protein
VTRNELAARCIARNAIDADDARLLLDALGLLTPDGIADDDGRSYELSNYDASLYGKETS